MHQAEPYGYLVINGKQIDNAQLGRMVGATSGEIRKWMGELETAGVFSRDEKGIFSRRMVKDERLRILRAEAGKLGGNPNLLNQTDNQDAQVLVNQPDKQKPTPSSSSSSSTSKPKSEVLSDAFVSFWNSWPSGERKVAKGKCAAAWKRKNLDASITDILAHVAAMKNSESWRGGYVPMPMTYINEARWEGAETTAAADWQRDIQ